MRIVSASGVEIEVASGSKAKSRWMRAVSSRAPSSTSRPGANDAAA